MYDGDIGGVHDWNEPGHAHEGGRAHLRLMDCVGVRWRHNVDALKTVTSGSRRFWKLYWGKRNRPFRQYLSELIRTLLMTLLHPNCQPLRAGTF
jgi:hypothetical protein